MLECSQEITPIPEFAKEVVMFGEWLLAHWYFVLAVLVIAFGVGWHYCWTHAEIPPNQDYRPD